MSSPTSINADILVKKLSDITKEMTSIISGDLKAGAEAIARKAKRNAPTDQGFLREGIGARRISDFEYEVYSNSVYSPYVEFGTLEKVSIPAGLEDYAAQFKGDFASGTYSQGGELSFKDAIYAWCQRKGIPEEAWYAIFISIWRTGTKPQPFFFPAVEEQRPLIIQQITQDVNDILQ